MSDKIWLRPAKNNKEARVNFVRYWAEYVKTHPDKDWSEQQNMLLNSQYESSASFIQDLSKTKEGQIKLKKIYKIQNVKGCIFLDKLQEN